MGGRGEETSGAEATAFGTVSKKGIDDWLRAAKEIMVAPRQGKTAGMPDLDPYMRWLALVFVDGELESIPTRDWAMQARYIPGQVWCPSDVPRTDVNPRPLSKLVPSNGLIGCFSADEKLIFATAWEPYQELFQGVGRCLHSDFRLGGLQPGETKSIRGKIYVVPNDVPALLKRYQKDFPEQTAKQ
jgi:hypothetical protein